MTDSAIVVGLSQAPDLQAHCTSHTFSISWGLAVRFNSSETKTIIVPCLSPCTTIAPYDHPVNSFNCDNTQIAGPGQLYAPCQFKWNQDACQSLCRAKSPCTMPSSIAPYAHPVKSFNCDNTVFRGRGNYRFHRHHLETY